jgi:hypothetical protein
MWVWSSPPKEIRELRNLTRYYKALIETRCASAAGVLLPGYK